MRTHNIVFMDVGCSLMGTHIIDLYGEMIETMTILGKWKQYGLSANMHTCSSVKFKPVLLLLCPLCNEKQ